MSGEAVNISIVSANPRPKPIAIKLMERHPLGSQIFYPLQDRPWLVVVCVEPKDGKSFRAFSATGRQGINYARNTWHFPLAGAGGREPLSCCGPQRAGHQSGRDVD